MSDPGHGAESPGPHGRFDGKQIPAQAFVDDDGSSPAAVTAALDQWRADRRSGTGLADVVTALLEQRLLVALVAVLDSTDPAGAEKDSHMAAASIQRPDGRRALVAFTGVAALRAWHPQARPLPVPAPEVARAAIDDGADALLIDGDCALAGRWLWALAEGRVPLPPAEDPAVAEAIASHVAAELGAASHFELVTHDEADLLVLLDPAAAADRTQVDRLAQALAGDPLLRSRLDRGLALGVFA